MDIEEYEKIMRKKYDEVEVPEKIGKNIIEIAKQRKEEANRKKILYRRITTLAACFILLIGITGIVYMNKKNIIEDADNKDNLNISYPVLYAYNSIEYPKYNIVKPAIIAVVRLEEILKYTNYSSKQDKYYKEPVTFISVESVKKIIGEVNSETKVYKFGGIVDVNNLKNIGAEFYDKNKRRVKLNSIEKNVEIVTNTSIIQAKPEIGKTYLVCLQYDSRIYDSYYCYGRYGFVEYDEATGKVKNVETGEWEDIDKEILDIESLKNSQN